MISGSTERTRCGKVKMIDGQVAWKLFRSPSHTIAGYSISAPEVGDGSVDGLIRLIKAVGEQAIKSKCECEGCQRWITLYNDWVAK
jgi:hypothetical protein